MERYFNITGSCNPQKHYMVNLESRLAQIKKMIEMEQYFCINRGRQHGKTTMLQSLEKYLSDEYIVVGMDFQVNMSSESFADGEIFSKAFVKAFTELLEFSSHEDLYKKVKELFAGVENMVDLFNGIKRICHSSKKPIVLLIDEVDQASNNQIFLDFLAQLRGLYLTRSKTPTFQSVILAGVHDIKNLRQKIRPDTEHKHNSPWNIASPFDVDMSFSPADIAGMLEDYENDKHTGMNITEISQMIYDYTSGYPVLVSSICKINDEKLDDKIKFTAEGIVKAVGQIVSTRQMLFESLINKLEDDEDLTNCVYNILINGDSFSYSIYDNSTNIALMYGFIKVVDGTVRVANRIFETVLYDFFLMSKKMQATPMYRVGMLNKPEFIQDGMLNMDLIIEKFVQYFDDIYGSNPEKFSESDGRKLFLLYLRPIINGTGNYYIEAQTRDHKRTDIIVDYNAKQFIIELKIWHGDEYNTHGEKQLCEYLDFYHIDKGYLISFNFNKSKTTGVHTIKLGDKTIIEGVV